MSQENTNNEISYEIYFIKKIRWILVFVIFFAVIIISNIPIIKKLDSLIYGSLSFDRCKINISNYEMNLLPLPHLNFQNIRIPGNCVNQRNAISLKDMQVYTHLLSFYPIFGPKFKIETKYNGNPLSLNLYSNFTFSHIKVLIEKNTIELARFASFLSGTRISGSIDVDSIIEIKNLRPSLLKINLQSKNLLMPSQTINNFMTPELPIKNVLINIESTSPEKKINIKKFILGDDQSPIRAEFEGFLKPGAGGIATSQVDLQGQMAFSDEFSQDPTIMLLSGTLLNGIDKRDNFYQIQLGGTLARFPQGLKMSSRR